jgi:ADP-heptose:LPS heptosyltransferase
MPKIDAAFVIYGNERNILLARLFGARKVYADNGGLMRPFLSHGRIDFGGLTHVQDKNAFLATLYTKKEFKPYAMCYEPPQVALRKAAELMAGCTAPVAVCTTTKKVAKDMPVEECARLMRLLNKRGNSPVFVGSGKMASVYRDSLLKMGAKFLDLTNKTSLPVLGAVLKKCGALVSVDTGTLHMGLSAGAATVAVYYVNNEKHIAAWSPKDLYRHRLIKGPDFSAENMIKKLEEMEKEEKEEANEQ